MCARQAVLPTPSESSALHHLLSCKHLVRISPLAATLMDLPASVAYKRLTAELSPLDPALTKNRGWGPRLAHPTRKRFQIPPATEESTHGSDHIGKDSSLASLFCRSLHQECFTTLLRSKGPTLSLKIAGCHPTIPILELTLSPPRSLSLYVLTSLLRLLSRCPLPTTHSLQVP
jgi:hypothetical protein